MKKTLVSCGIIGLFGLLLWALKDICLPFLLGFVLAYVLRPLMNRLSRRYTPTTAARLTLCCMLAFFVFTLFVLIPIIQAQVVFLVQKAPAYLQGLVSKIEPMLGWMQDYFGKDQVAAWEQDLTGKGLVLIHEAGTLILGLFGQSSLLISVAMALVITPVVTYYCLKEWDVIMKKAGDLIPRNYIKTVTEMLNETDSLLAAFLRGQCLVCLSLALYYGLSLWFVGLDLGFAVGVLTGLFAFIPYLGVLTGFVLSLILACIQGPWSLVAWVLGVFLVGQVLEGYILTPHLIGKRVGLSPVLVIFIILAGGTLFGFWGVLLAIPGAIIIGVPLRMLVKAYRSSSLYKGEDDKGKQKK